jgi:glutaconyl-CoA/methylmalonyl-CoA decarboxylase subunit gamma
MKKFSFTIHGNKYEVEVLSVEDNVATLEVNGTRYSVDIHRDIVQPKTPVLIRQEVPAPRRSETKIKKNWVRHKSLPPCQAILCRYLSEPAM